MTMFPYVTRPRKCSSLGPLEHHIGGGVSELFSLAQLQPYILKDFMMIKPFAELMYKFEGYHIKTKQVEEDIIPTRMLCFVTFLYVNW